MLVGIPKETKIHERRVAATPADVRALTRDGHTVLVERGAGLGAGFSDDEYQASGAQLTGDAAHVFGEATLLLKVKEPTPDEYALLGQGQTLFTYLHLAAAPALAEVLMTRGTLAIGYETVQRNDGSLPLLAPMSAIAGRLSVQAGARFLEAPAGGRGVLLGGVPGVPRGEVVILGAGVVGREAAKMAIGLGARVTVFDIERAPLAALDDQYGARIDTRLSTPETIAEALVKADLLIGAVLVPGARAPRLVTREQLGSMPRGSVVVDVAVDQGGCVETIRPTDHDAPTYTVDRVVHYGVANMPAAVPRTATLALTGATMPFVRALAAGGEHAIDAHPELARGVNVRGGAVVHAAVRTALSHTG